MPLILNGTTGISGVDGSAGTPSYVGVDTDTGVLFPAANTLALSTGGTERVRVDSAGRLIVGGTSAVLGARIESVAVSNGDALALRGRSADDYSSLLFIANAAVTEYARISALNTSALIFGTGSSGTERMRIDSSGNLILGTTAVAAAEGYRFYKNYGRYDNGTFTGFIGSGTSLGSAAASDFSIRSENALAFMSGGSTERGRFTSGGYFKASNNGTYNNVSGSNHEFYNSANAETLIVRNANASFNSEALIVSADRNTTNNSYYFLRLNVPGVANRLLIADSGSISTAGSVQLGDAGAPPTSGVGIKFPATQSASSDANTLDDYEEGTWTPTISAATPPSGATLSISGATYTKIGNFVFACCDVTVTSVGSGGSGILSIRGLPFASKIWGGYNPTSCETESLTSNIGTVIQPLINQNTTFADFYYGWNSTGGPSSFAYSLIKVGTIIRFTCYYPSA